jgi:opacity protein-like surface antigen
MKSLCTPLRFLVAAIALSTAAGAQSPRKVQVGLGGGATVPIGVFADDVKSGFHGGAYLQYEPDGNIWGVRAEAQYHRASYTDEFLADVGATPDDDLNNGVLYAGASAILIGRRRDRSVTPYLVGGLGLYRLTVSRSGTVTTSASENGFGFNGGAGVRFGGAMGLFAEIRFHSFTITPEGAESSSYQMIPVSLGVRF